MNPMRPRARATLPVLLLIFCAAPVSADGVVPPDPPQRWWKGNLHTHTLWSDGNEFPEMAAEWYRTHEYNFLALSDHNVLSQGLRWMPISEIIRRRGNDALDKYLTRFGAHWVETRGSADAGTLEVRLKPLNEFRALVEERGRFILIQGEEITDALGRIPIHINATNLAEVIPPQHGADIQETIRNNLRAIEEQAQRIGRPILPHINHPNYGWGLTAEDIAAVVEEHFFEVFNGHTSVHNLGNDQRASVERMWDIANTIRIARLNAPPLFGLATDDSHHYHGRVDVSVPGRGWIMVRSRHLTPESLIRALDAGDFYASTGVILKDVRFDPDSGVYEIEVEPNGDETYMIEFIGTREGFDSASKPVHDANGNEMRTTQRYSNDIGQVLATVEGLRARYALRGNELYVRAVITSSAAPEKPTADSRRKKAWTQPVGWRRRIGLGSEDRPPIALPID